MRRRRRSSMEAAGMMVVRRSRRRGDRDAEDTRGVRDGSDREKIAGQRAVAWPMYGFGQWERAAGEI